MDMNDKLIAGVVRQFDLDSLKGRIRMLDGEDDINFQLGSDYLTKLVMDSIGSSEPILLVLDSSLEVYDGYKINYKE